MGKSMPKRKSTNNSKPIEQYEHKDKERLNNPPVGLVTPDTDKDGWSKLAKNLKAEIDEEKIEAFRGTLYLPFVKPDSVKIIDDREIESLRIIYL